MTIWRVGTWVILILLAAALLVALPCSDDDMVAAATKPSAHFQTTSEGTGERFLAGPFAAGTQLGITSFTIAAPKESAPVSVALRVAHGAGGACEGFAIAQPQLSAQVPAGNTLNLVFPEPLFITEPTESWCLWLENDVFTMTTIVGVKN